MVDLSKYFQDASVAFVVAVKFDIDVDATFNTIVVIYKAVNFVVFIGVINCYIFDLG